MSEEAEEIAKSGGWKSILDALEKNLELLKESERALVKRWSLQENGLSKEKKKKVAEGETSAQKGFVSNGSKDAGTY